MATTSQKQSKLLCECDAFGTTSSGYQTSSSSILYVDRLAATCFVVAPIVDSEAISKSQLDVPTLSIGPRSDRDLQRY